MDGNIPGIVAQSETLDIASLFDCLAERIKAKAPEPKPNIITGGLNHSFNGVTFTDHAQALQTGSDMLKTGGITLVRHSFDGETWLEVIGADTTVDYAINAVRKALDGGPGF